MISCHHASDSSDALSHPALTSLGFVGVDVEGKVLAFGMNVRVEEGLYTGYACRNLAAGDSPSLLERGDRDDEGNFPP